MKNLNKLLDDFVEKNRRNISIFSGAAAIVMTFAIFYGIYIGAKDIGRRIEIKNKYYSTPYNK